MNKYSHDQEGKKATKKKVELSFHWITLILYIKQVAWEPKKALQSISLIISTKFFLAS